MFPVTQPLAQSENKALLFQRLGLNERDPRHRHLYSLMKAEAIEGWSRLTARRDALSPRLQQDWSLEPPYTFGQIDEVAFQAEAIYMWHHAQASTRTIYELGQHSKGDLKDNWIIRWLLWHVFRYRDDRNRIHPNLRQVAPPLPQSQGSTAAHVRHENPVRFWDPVREHYRD
ncbi:hypothetical protein M409DRAFT_68900 [Zasmidium cellare ATCC 36951]|uniref:Uncharacterized protein n=1 Tax=Zasmidium cellare ATCC 36951 TaxID=1080233 RepID=A0A6A6C773_ZASCE|nr:uncharacterized protein M409DRAFT_68900 [Zasmidium cellare ATCC 36951]KAF2162964.1 hypothetical protein M409DRAFT_68900 [Zasmidium cellare ATCC 36951]